jgi:hypothetical protein
MNNEIKVSEPPKIEEHVLIFRKGRKSEKDLVAFIYNKGAKDTIVLVGEDVIKKPEIGFLYHVTTVPKHSCQIAIDVSPVRATITVDKAEEKVYVKYSDGEEYVCFYTEVRSPNDAFNTRRLINKRKVLGNDKIIQELNEAVKVLNDKYVSEHKEDITELLKHKYKVKTPS